MSPEILLSHNLLWMRPIPKPNKSKDNESLTEKRGGASRKSAMLLMNRI